MAGETIIAVVGNLTADPELRSTKNGRSVAGFTIASTPRTFDRQSNQWVYGDALFLRCTVWCDLAEHCAQSLAKGMRVIAQGRLTQHSWEDEQHHRRTSMELQVDEIGPSLRYAAAQVAKAQRGTAGAQPHSEKRNYRKRLFPQPAGRFSGVPGQPGGGHHRIWRDPRAGW